MKGIICFILDKMVQKSIIDAKEKEIYSFGLRRIIISGGNYLVMIFIGILLCSPVNMVVYLLSFVPLRVLGGGIHADSEKTCFFASTVLSIMVLVILKYKMISEDTMVILTAMINLYLWKNAPVNCTEDKISKTEYLLFRERFRTVLFFEMLVMIILFIAGRSDISYVIMVATVMEGILIAIGKWFQGKNKDACII